VARVLAQIPDPRRHLVHYYGAYPHKEPPIPEPPIPLLSVAQEAILKKEICIAQEEPLRLYLDRGRAEDAVPSSACPGGLPRPRRTYSAMQEAFVVTLTAPPGRA